MRASAMLGVLPLGPVQFNEPAWLWLIPVTWALALWWGRGSLSGLGTSSRRAALAVRLVVLALLAGAMAQPHLRDKATKLAVTVVMDVSKSIPAPLQRQADTYIAEAARTHMEASDELGVVTLARDSYVQRLPSSLNKQVERNVIGATEGTDIAGGLRLALAVRPSNAAYRITLATDGNETAGSVLQEAEAAKAAGVPIDVLPLRFVNDREVIVEELIAPTTARMGENVNLKVRVSATRDTPGRMSVLVNGEPLDLDPDGPDMGWTMLAKEGSHVYTVPTTVGRAGAQEFEAVFEPLLGPDGTPVGDAILENNRALAVTFVSGEGKVLIFADDPSEPEQLIEALSHAKIDAKVVSPDQGPRSLTELAAYDAVVLCNVSAYSFSEQAMEEMRQYVHDGGGGLVMIGGPNGFGAGGWIGTPVEDALPVRLDPPQKRRLPRGALALVIHSVEMPQGIHYGKKTAEAALDALTRLDLFGVNEFTGGVTKWVHPLSEVGDKTAARQAINRLTFGDMPDFDPSLKLALDALSAATAGAKHVVIISDGDPNVSNSILAQFSRAKITISTVGVFPHDGGSLNRMRMIAERTGGKYYAVTTTAQLATLPQIFVKEAQMVRRPLLWEGDPFIPAVQAVPTETMRGISGVPPISGYVVAADREGLSMVTIRGKENDPIAAQWQYGLGRVVAFTSDAATRWTRQWARSNVFQAFWEQHLRWSMRASGDARVRVVTENQGDETRVIVEATDTQGERLNFASMHGRVALPGGGGVDLELQQVGPGRYEGRFKTRRYGSYVASLRYSAPNPAGGDAKPLEGTVLAAVTRPFADEFRALADNTALLQQVAQMTGGRVLPSDPRSPEADLWLREGLKMPVALTPIWQTVALCAIGLFLVDVGVRRVRIDIPGLAAAAVGVFRKGRQRSGQQMASLRAAREKARQRIGERGAMEGEAAAPVEAPLPTVAPTVAKAKFEATADQLVARPTDPIALKGEPERTRAVTPSMPQAKSSPDEAGLGRLMKAKKRAQEGFEKEQNE